MICPSCEFENVIGVELCEKCGMDLTDLGVPRPTTGMQARILKDPLGNLAPWEIIKVAPTATVSHALQVMREKRHGSVLIVDGRSLKGIFTERDLLLKVMGGSLDADKTPVTDVMTPNPITLKEDNPLAYAIHLMAVRGIRHIPILRDGVPLGVVSVRGILGYLTKQAR